MRKVPARLARTRLGAQAASQGGRIPTSPIASVMRSKTKNPKLRASAETASIVGDAEADHAAVRGVISSVWSVADHAPLGYVHASTGPDRLAMEQRVQRAVLGPVPCCSTRIASPPAGASDGAIDAVLAATALLRGFTPPPRSRELEHDRVLVHASGPRGHHAAVLLEARP